MPAKEHFDKMSVSICVFLQSEMVAQKEALDTKHCRALETLKNQVLLLVVSTLLLFNVSKWRYFM